MKRSKIQHERWFILGIIEGENQRGKQIIEAVKLYNPITEESRLESLNSVEKRIKKYEEIAGARIRSVLVCGNIRENVVLTESYYRRKDLPKLNGAGNVIEAGKGVITGCLEQNGQLMYQVVDAELHKKLITRTEALEEKPIGVYRNSIMRASQIRIDLIREERKQ